jgi:hypothetical protein
MKCTTSHLDNVGRDLAVARERLELGFHGRKGRLFANSIETGALEVEVVVDQPCHGGEVSPIQGLTWSTNTSRAPTRPTMLS